MENPVAEVFCTNPIVSLGVLLLLEPEKQLKIRLKKRR
jgi:hypothetical protein